MLRRRGRGCLRRDFGEQLLLGGIKRVFLLVTLDRNLDQRVDPAGGFGHIADEHQRLPEVVGLGDTVGQGLVQQTVFRQRLEQA